MGGVGNWRSVGEDRRGGNDRGGLEDWRGGNDRGCHERTLDGHLVGVGVAGGDRDGVGDR